MSGRPRVPVTVIGGYLGAGKTTMIARLLERADGRRLAVLVNDFGALNLDAALLGASATRTTDRGLGPDDDSTGGASNVDTSNGGAPTRMPEVVELTNGCVCCTMADSLGDGLDQVLALEPRPDQIVIEASGVADPGRIADYGRGWPGVRLDAVVTVVDTESIRTLAADPFVGTTVVRQLRAADVLALSHLDRLAPPDRVDVRSWLADQSPAPMIALEHGAVDPALLVGVARPPAPTNPEGTGRDGTERDADDGAVRPDGLRSVAAAIPNDVEPERLAWLLERWPPEVVRVKGILPTSGGDALVVHRVGRRWSMAPERLPNRSTDAALVVIAVGPPTRRHRPPMPTTATELVAQLMGHDPTAASGPSDDPSLDDDDG